MIKELREIGREYENVKNTYDKITSADDRQMYVMNLLKIKDITAHKSEDDLINKKNEMIVEAYKQQNELLAEGISLTKKYKKLQLTQGEVSYLYNRKVAAEGILAHRKQEEYSKDMIPMTAKETQAAATSLQARQDENFSKPGPLAPRGKDEDYGKFIERSAKHALDTAKWMEQNTTNDINIVEIGMTALEPEQTKNITSAEALEADKDQTAKTLPIKGFSATIGGLTASTKFDKEPAIDPKNKDKELAYGPILNALKEQNAITAEEHEKAMNGTQAEARSIMADGYSRLYVGAKKAGDQSVMDVIQLQVKAATRLTGKRLKDKKDHREAIGKTIWNAVGTKLDSIENKKVGKSEKAKALSAYAEELRKSGKNDEKQADEYNAAADYIDSLAKKAAPKASNNTKPKAEKEKPAESKPAEDQGEGKKKGGKTATQAKKDKAKKGKANPKKKTDEKSVGKKNVDASIQTSAGYGIIAADYLFTGGRNAILSTDYFLQALTAAFPFAAEQINSIRNKYASKLGNIADDLNSEPYKNAIAEIRAALNTTYQNSEIESLFDEILNNSTGFVSREGHRVSSRLETLNEEHQNKLNNTHKALEAGPDLSLADQLVQEIKNDKKDSPNIGKAIALVTGATSIAGEVYSYAHGHDAGWFSSAMAAVQQASMFLAAGVSIATKQVMDILDEVKNHIISMLKGTPVSEIEKAIKKQLRASIEIVNFEDNKKSKNALKLYKAKETLEKEKIIQRVFQRLSKEINSMNDAWQRAKREGKDPSTDKKVMTQLNDLLINISQTLETNYLNDSVTEFFHVIGDKDRAVLFESEQRRKQLREFVS